MLRAMEEYTPRDRLDAPTTGFMEAKLLLTGVELRLFDPAVNMVAMTGGGRVYTAGEIAAWGEAAGRVCDGWDHLGPRSCLITLRRPEVTE